MGGGVAKLSPRRQVFMNNYHAPEPATRAPSTYGWCQVSDWGEMPRRLSNTPRSPRARATDEVGHASRRAGEHVGACNASEHIARFQDATSSCTASMLQEHLRETEDELPKKPESGLFFKCLEQRLDAVGREIERKEHKLREERRQYERSCCSSSLLSNIWDCLSFFSSFRIPRQTHLLLTISDCYLCIVQVQHKSHTSACRKSRLQQDLQQLKTSGDSTVEDREHPLPLHVELIERALATG